MWLRRLLGWGLVLVGLVANEYVLAIATHRRPGELELGTRQNILALEVLLIAAGLALVHPHGAARLGRRARDAAATRWLVAPLREPRFWWSLAPVAAWSLWVQSTGWRLAEVPWSHPAVLLVALQGAAISALTVSAIAAWVAGLGRAGRWWALLAVLPWVVIATVDWSFLVLGGMRPRVELLQQARPEAVGNYLSPMVVLMAGATAAAAGITAWLTARRRGGAGNHPGQRWAWLALLVLLQPAWLGYRVMGVPFTAPQRMQLWTVYHEARHFDADPLLRIGWLWLVGTPGRVVAQLDPAQRAKLEPFATLIAADRPVAPLPLATPITRVVLVTIESLGLPTVSRFNRQLPGPLTPTIDGLPLSFSRQMTTALPTRPGLASHLCSHPNGAVVAELGHPNGLPAYLVQHGWRTAMVESASRAFEAGERHFRELGYQDIRDLDWAKDQPGLASYHAGWGLCDRITYRLAADWLDQHRDAPAFVQVLTVDTHSPRGRLDYRGLDYPPTPGWITGTGDAAPLLQAWFRADHDLGLFLADLRQRRLLDASTVVVITGDHSCPPNEVYLAIPGAGVERFEAVPFAIVAGQALPAADLHRLGSQADTAPTIAHLVGLPPLPGWWGASVFSPTAPPLVLAWRHDEATVIAADGTTRPAAEDTMRLGRLVLVPGPAPGP